MMDKRIKHLEETLFNQDKTVKDCGMLLRRWCSKYPDDTQMSIQTLDFLKRKGLLGSVLRKKK